MSIDISWCEVCSDGSLEGDPEMISCSNCQMSFHVHCAINAEELRKALAEEDQEEGGYSESDCSPSCCPKCSAEWQDPKIKEFAEGYILSLLCNPPDQDSPFHLRGSSLEPLIDWFINSEFNQEGWKFLIPLDLQGFKSFDDSLGDLLSGHAGDVTFDSDAAFLPGFISKISPLYGRLEIRSTKLSREQWEGLALRGGLPTVIRNIKNISLDEASLFSNKEIEITIGVDKIDDAVFEELTKGEGRISLPYLTELTLKQAESLSKTSRCFELYSLEKPSQEIIDLLSKNEGNLSLPYWE